MIYFIQPEVGGPIKIGKTNDVSQRLRSINAMSPWPLKLLSVARGGYVGESYLRFKLSAHIYRFEWYRPADEIIALVHESSCAGFIKDLPSEIRSNARREWFKSADEIAAFLSIGREKLAEFLGVPLASLSTAVGPRSIGRLVYCARRINPRLDTPDFLSPAYRGAFAEAMA